ncbi:hypothetical protein J6590_078644 [Homalodisca vitripennis]|nr:hypothetical protein J6590_078644 [Homalodisca vitripennis]
MKEERGAVATLVVAALSNLEITVRLRVVPALIHSHFSLAADSSRTCLTLCDSSSHYDSDSGEITAQRVILLRHRLLRDDWLVMRICLWRNVKSTTAPDSMSQVYHSARFHESSLRQRQILRVKSATAPDSKHCTNKSAQYASVLHKFQSNPESCVIELRRVPAQIRDSECASESRKWDPSPPPSLCLSADTPNCFVYSQKL